MEKKDKKMYNPFEGRDRELVWKEIRSQARPVTREEAFRQMNDMLRKSKKDE